MSILLFKMRGVEEDEAEDIRLLLDEHEIDFYETSNGAWGLGYAAIWLKSDALYDQAKAIIADYQDQRAQLAQQAYQQLCLEGNQPTLWSRFKTQPSSIILTLIALMIVAMFALLPFVFL